MNSMRRHPESLDPKPAPAPCPRCGDEDGDCLNQPLARASVQNWSTALIACRIGMVALQLTRLNDFMEGSEKDEREDDSGV
jgi:hypothetical protein